MNCTLSTTCTVNYAFALIIIRVRAAVNANERATVQNVKKYFYSKCLKVRERES